MLSAGQGRPAPAGGISDNAPRVGEVRRPKKRLRFLRAAEFGGAR